jgi:thioesterase domain-containing protein
VMSEIEKAFDKNLRLSALFQAPTVEQLANLISREARSQHWSSLLALQANGSKPPFFWVHGETSDAFLPRWLGAEQPLYGLTHQSGDGAPARFTTVESIAAHYLSEIRTVQPHGPYFLGGYCFGAVVAFEMAQQVKKQKQEVALLFLLEPSDPWSEQPSASRIGLGVELRTKAASVRSEAARHLHNLKALNVKQKLRYMLNRLIAKIKNHAIASPVNKIVRQARCHFYLRLGCALPSSLRTPYILQVYREAMQAYRPRPYSGPIVLFQTGKHLLDSHSEWFKLATGELEVYAVPGNHTDVLSENRVRVWAQQLKTCLDRARSIVYRTSALPNHRADRASIPKRHRPELSEDNRLTQSSQAVPIGAHYGSVRDRPLLLQRTAGTR